jgi:hypothetical protein
MAIDRLGIPDLGPAYDAGGFVTSRGVGPDVKRALYMQQRLEQNMALYALQDQIVQAKLSIEQIRQLQETVSDMQQTKEEANG